MNSKKAKAKKAKKNASLIAVIAAVVIIIAVFAAYRRAPDDKAAAIVNGEKIMKEDVLREYLKVPVEYRSVITVDSILEGMIVEALLIEEASKQVITASGEEVETYLKETLDAYDISEDDLETSLEKNNLTLEELKESLHKKLIINKLLNQTILSEITISDEEIENYYNENTEQFTIAERIKARHILVNTSKEAALIRNKALGGVSFGGLAEEHSIGPSASKGGNLGWFERGQMVEEFEDAAFALKVGEISPVVETRFGYHIIKLEDRKSERTDPLDEVKNIIEEDLILQKQNYAVGIFVQQLKSAADIQIFMGKKEEPEGIPLVEKLGKKNDAEETEEKETAEDASEDEITGLTISVEQEEPQDEAQEEPEEPEIEESSAQSLAECLTSKSVKMYGSDSSTLSQEQKSLFGDDFSNIDYTDCSSNKDVCKEAGIISYPAWVINGKKYPGKYSLEKLAEMSGC